MNDAGSSESKEGVTNKIPVAAPKITPEGVSSMQGLTPQAPEVTDTFESAASQATPTVPAVEPSATPVPQVDNQPAVEPSSGKRSIFSRFFSRNSKGPQSMRGE